MEFAGKVRAGRAFLGWSQDRLAQESDLSLQGIQKIERAETQPTARTQGKITKAFARQGVVFTDRGIEHEAFPVIFVEGNDHESCYIQLLHDAFSHLQEHKNKELLIMYADDKVSPPAVNDLYRKMRATGIRMRQLIEDGNSYIIGPLAEYRYIPKGFFINRVTLIYGDRTASETGDFNRAMIRPDAVNAEIQRNTFNMLWSILKAPTKSTSDERFD